MKTKIFIFFTFIYCSFFYAQNTGITYQALIINPQGEKVPGINNMSAPLVNKEICMRFSIYDYNNLLEYAETIKTTTDSGGIVNLIIGSGNKTGGYASSFSAILWDKNTKRLKVEFDVNATCADYLEISDQTFSYVPFSYYSSSTKEATSTTTGSIKLAGDLAGIGSTASAPIITSGAVTTEKIANGAIKNNKIGELISVMNGGTGASSLIGYVVGNGQNAMSSVTSIPVSDVDGAQTTANLESNINSSPDPQNKYPSVQAVVDYISTVSTSGTTPDASTTTKGKLQLAGDLTGTAASPEIAAGAVTTSKLADASVTTAKVNDGAITDAKIASGISASKVGLGNVDNTSDANKPVSTATQTALDLKENLANKSTDIAADAASTTKYPSVKTIKDYVDTSVAAATIADADATTKGKLQLAGDLTGTAASPEIAAGAVTTSKLADDAVTTTKIKDGNVTTDKIANASITNAKLAEPISISNGGTGSSTQNFVDLTTNQSIAGIKNFDSDIIANGVHVGKGNGNGDSNVAIGTNLGTGTGYRNTGVGAGALQNYSGTSFGNNTGVGFGSLQGLTSGYGNTSIGGETLASVANNDNNTAIGNQTLRNAVSSNNTALGANAGNGVTSGSSNTLLGSQADLATGTNTNATAIGYGAIVNGSNTIQLGNTNVTLVNTSGKLKTGTVTYPNNNGAAGQFLSTDGNGNASWTDLPNINTSNITDGAVTDAKIASGISASKVGLGNVDNTSDANKPVSTATQTALDLKENLANKSTDIAADAASTTKYPSVKTIKDYVDTSVAAATIADADATTKGKLQLAGDLTGTAALPEIAAGAVTTSKLADASVTTAKVNDGAITDAKIASGISASKVGLGNVDNTSDANKPVSTATQTALDLKENLANKSTDIAADGNSDTKYPSTKAVKTYVSSLVSSSSTTAVPYTGATGAVNLGAFDLTVNGIKIGLGNNAESSNTGVGAGVLSSVTTGMGNGTALTALGYYALYQNTTGFSNTAIGWNSLKLNTNGSNNTAIGKSALISNTSGGANFAGGGDALNSNTTGNFNTAVGTSALGKITSSSSSNTALGSNAGNLFGSGAGSNLTTSNKGVFIGSNTRPSANTSINEVVIGADAVGNGNNTVTIGNSSTTDNYFTGNINGATWNGTAISIAKGGTGATTAGAALTALGAQSEANLSTDISTDAASTTKYPAVKTIKDYVDTSVAAATIADADATTKGKLQLAGDLTGTAASPAVTTGAITTAKLAADAVTSAKIADGTIAVADIANDAIETAKIKDANVTNAKLDKANIPLSGFGAAAADVALGSNKLTGVADPTAAQDAATKNYVDTKASDITTLADGKIYVGNASNEATEVTLSGDVTMTNAGVTAIGTGKVVTAMIADANVTTAKLAADAVETAKIKDANVTYAKIQNVSATDKVLGRVSSGAGVIEEIATTGSGNVVRATSPTLVTPALGTPSAVVLTNATGLPLSSGVTGTLPVANGGTGSTTLTANNVLLGNGTSALQTVAPSTAGNILRSDGTTWSSSTLALDDLSDAINDGNSGNSNLAIGTNAMYSNSGNSNQNVAIGLMALKNTNAASQNVAIGQYTMGYNKTLSGSGNVAIGRSAMNQITSGSNNTAIGLGAGGFAPYTGDFTGTNNTYIGYNASPSSLTASNEIVLGNTAVTVVKTSGKLTTGAVTYPNTDGTSGQFLTTNGSGTVSFTTLPAINLASGVTGTLPIANGGTGAATKTAAFDALSPMTTAGDIIYGGTSGTGTRLGAGTDGQVLTLASGVPSWATPSGISVGAISGSSTANGASITSGVLNLAPANASNGGVVTTGAQTFAGAKTFNSDLIVNSLTIGLGGGSAGSASDASGSATNVAIGANTLRLNSTGTFNTAIGSDALKSSTAGLGNIAVGQGAFRSLNNSAGSENRNTAIGTGAFYNMTSGQYNVGLGEAVLFNVTSGSDNVALGRQAGFSSNGGQGVTNADRSVFIGSGVKPSGTTSTNEIVIGYNAIGNGNNTTTIGNSSTTNARILGALALPNTTASTSTTTGALTVAGGAGIAGNAYIGGTISIAGGTPGAGKVLTSDANGLASWATPSGVTTMGAIGSTPNANGATISGNTLTIQPANSIFGGIVSTNDQTFTGAKTFSSNITSNGILVGRLGGSGNVVLGSNSLNTSTTSDYNTAIGNYALNLVTSGGSNVALGYASLYNNTTGTNNVAIGRNALSSTTTGADNTALGNQSGNQITTGNGNVFLGSDAGRYIGASGTTGNTTGSNSVFIGYLTSPLSNGDTNEIVISGGGTRTAGLGSNTTLIGNSSTTLTQLMGALNIPSTTASTSTTTGALRVGGGVGIAGALNVGTTATITGSAAISSTTASTSTTTGALTVAGGAGIAGDLNIGGNTKLTGTIEIDGGSPGAGKVLVSDANGVASWANASGSAVTTSTAAYAITLAESIVFYTGTAAGAFTIPAAAAGNAGKQIIIKNKTGFNITITPASGSIYIDNANASAANVSVGIEASNNWIKLVSDGTQWNVLRALF